MKDEGYDFVPLPERVRRAARPEARHDRRVAGAITASVDVTLVTEQPVHVGSGFKTMRDQRVVRAAVTSGELPCVPGSTLKGVLRSRYEAITLSCALFPASHRLVKVRSSSFDGAKARLSDKVTQRDVFSPCSGAQICAACALFGRMSLRGRIAVSDFMPASAVSLEIAEVAEMFTPNLHHVGPFNPTHNGGETILEVRNLHGRKFARGRGPETQGRERIEVIPVGIGLHGKVRLANVTPAELGGFLAALGVQPTSRLKVGGGKGHGLGRVRASLNAVHSHPGSTPISADMASYEGSFRSGPDVWEDGLDALVRIHEERSQP